MPDKPFFVYAPGATPCAAPRADRVVGQVQGSFRPGLGHLREEILARREGLGVIPPGTELTARHEEIPAWEDMPDQLKPVLARQMEVYAGFLEHTSHIGRLVDALGDLGVLDDTLVYYIIGDNGASAEGTINGSFNETFIFNDAAALETPGDSDHGFAHPVTSSAPRPRTTTSRSVGLRDGRRCSGRSKSLRTGAAPATARSCIGRVASPPLGRSARSSTA